MQTNYIVFIVRDSNYNILVIKNRFITAMFTPRGIVYAMAVPAVPSVSVASQRSRCYIETAQDRRLHVARQPSDSTPCPRKNVHLLFFEYLCQRLTDFNDFWQVKS